MPDIPASTATTAVFEGNPLFLATYAGEFETFSDNDWIRVNLVAGRTYHFYAEAVTAGVASGDAYLRLYNSAGSSIGSDDDSGSQNNAILAATIATTGTYFIAVSEVFGNPGEYTVGVTADMAYFDDVRDETDQSSTFAAGNPRALGGRGQDTFNNYHYVLGDQDNDTINGSTGDDWFSGGTGNDLIQGLNGHDTLFGDGGSDRLFGDAGNDVLYGGPGSDQLFGGSGFNALYGGDGADLLQDGDEASTLVGGQGNDQLWAAGGIDTLNGGTGTDRMEGGTGNDTYFADVFNDLIIETDAAIATGGDDIVNYSGTGTFSLSVNVERLTLTHATANVNGTGNALGNSIIGSVAGNVLNGAAGNDWLFGRAGNDFLFGGVGNDQFIFNTAPHSTLNRDRILDLNVNGNDTIRLENAIFAGLGPANNHFVAVGQFNVNNNNGLALQADDRIIYDRDNGQLWYDSNGSLAGGVRVNFATVNPNQVLTWADFYVI